MEEIAVVKDGRCSLLPILNPSVKTETGSPTDVEWKKNDAFNEAVGLQELER